MEAHGWKTKKGCADYSILWGFSFFLLFLTTAFLAFHSGEKHQAFAEMERLEKKILISENLSEIENAKKAYQEHLDEWGGMVEAEFYEPW
jgi:hypothetical protein